MGDEDAKMAKVMLPIIPDLQRPFGRPRVRPSYLGMCACPGCYATKVYQCSSCFTVAYCSAEHQSLDWESHQHKCSPVVKLGKRFYKTEKRVEANTVLFNIQPIMVSPNDFQIPPGLYQCIVCCSIFKGLQPRCKRCQWPVCSEECSKNPLHSANECEIFASTKIRQSSAPPNLLMILRCLKLQTLNPAAFNKIMNVSKVFTGDKTLRSAKAYQEDDMLATFLQDERCLKDLLSPLPTRMDIIQFIKVVEACTVDAFEGMSIDFSVVGEPGPVKRFVRPKFVISEKLNFQRHCSPNMRWSISCGPNLTLSESFATFRNVVRLEPNTVLTAGWTELVSCGTAVRQRLLTSRFHDPCSCSRCADPTEFGTEYNTLRCPKCHKVSVRPVNPMNKNTRWRCNTTNGCAWRVRTDMPNHYVLTALGLFMREIERIYTNLDFNAGLAALLKHYHNTNPNSRYLFHRRHFVLVRAYIYYLGVFTKKLSLAESTSQIDSRLLNTLEEMASVCLDVYPKLVPGSTEFLGRLLYQQQAFMSARCLRKAEWFFKERLSQDNGSGIVEDILYVRGIQVKALEALQGPGIGTVSNEQVGNLKRMLAALKKAFVNRSIIVDVVDDNLATQLFNMYAIVTSVPPRIVPNQPRSYVLDLKSF